MRALVIGGTQFMGRRIVEILLEQGDEEAVLHRRATHDLPDDWTRGTPVAHVEAAARACGDRLQRHVFMSSIVVYPPGLDRREDEALVPEDGPHPYVQHKVSAGRALFRPRSTHALGRYLTAQWLARASRSVASPTGRSPESGDVAPSREGADTRRQLAGWCHRQRLAPARTMTFDDPGAVKWAVMAGLGVAMVSRLTVE